ncbi:HD domain-containing protein [Demequina mangrovi]|uniref:Predicted metal-dependent phosphohydrolase, HD superfamily n=1 Tax=Demequina mangrovi TaxID=1043493 RepID=A0A1H6YAD3_9MICO|nr:hypothetical protein [Demequina mangrovi]SEJ38211.1 Predicted metal-dependent phosphohydrolase, HD superfamily [Demequina mangrovi]
MATAPAPAWLLPAYVRDAAAVGATASDAEVAEAGARLLLRWQNPARRFHDVRHLVELLNRVDELQQETRRPHCVRLAAWYHGAVFASDSESAYAARGGEDEDASAEYARMELRDLGVPDAKIDAIATMVKGLTRHVVVPDSPDAAVLSDADLAILASDPQRYKAYIRDVREEYAEIPEDRFLESRRAIVARLLSRDRLYTSPLGATWEAQARQNLTAELARLDKAIAAMSPAADGA